MIRLQELLDSLRFEPVGPDAYRASSMPVERPVAFGGQLLAQSIVAGALGHEDKTVKTVHTVFARGASPEGHLDIVVDPMHRGRGFASSTVTISQGGRLCTRSLVLLSGVEEDFIRHAVAPAAELPTPPAASGEDWDVQVVGDVDLMDPDAVGPAELQVWSRFADAPGDPVTNQALLAFASDFFLIGAAMRPHAGVGQSQAHVTVSTGVISHTLTFHEPVPASEWLLLAHHSTYAGRGRSYGRADVHRANGELVASFVQDSMIRAMAGATG